MATTKKPNVSTTAEGDDEVADVSRQELAGAANAGAAEKSAKGGPKGAFKGEQDPKKHPDWTTFRTDVENTAAGDLNQDPREPYPTGNPPDPAQEFAQIWGFKPGEGGKGGIAGAKDTPNPKAKGD